MAKLPDDELKALIEEIRMAEILNEQELEPQMRESLQRYTGRHVPDIAVDWSIVINEIYPIVQFNLPSIFFRNPRVFLKPRQKTFVAKRRDPRSGQMVNTILDSTKSARTQEAIVNYQLVEMRYKEQTRRTLLDALLFKHGILWHGYKGDFGMTEEDSFFIRDEQIFVQRINPLRFIKDPSFHINEINEARWIGRSFDMRLIDMLEDDSLDVDKKKIKGNLGFGELVGTKDFLNQQRAGGQDKKFPHTTLLKPLLERSTKEFQTSPYARFVKVYEIFLRPTKKQARNGEKGKVLLLTPEQFKPLRESPWPYKAEGWPAKILMFNEVPEQQFGMSDIETYGRIADHKNLVINQQIRNAEQMNKVWVGIAKEDADEEDVEKARLGQNTIITFDGDDAKKRMFVASAAGQGSSELYILDGRIDQNLQDKSGVTDLKRGAPPRSGEESAASVRARLSGGSARPAYRQDLMSDHLKESIAYIVQLDKQFMPVKEAVRIVGSTDIEWSDNFTKEEIQAETDVELDVISMLPDNPERELRETGEILNLMIQALTNPDILKKIHQEGKTFNLSPVIDTLLQRLRIRDPETFRQIKPEEAQGFVSVAEVRAAKQNIDAVLQGQPPPSPPQEGQDHRARLEIYASIAGLLQKLNQQSDLLNQLIEIQAGLMQAEQEKANPRIGSELKRRSNVRTFGGGRPSTNGQQPVVSAPTA
jgi:hypothetical protein